MADKPTTGKTGKQPTGNSKGQQGSGMASTNPKGQNAKAPTSIIATGKGPKSKP